MKRILLVLAIFCQVINFVGAQASASPKPSPSTGPTTLLDENKITFGDQAQPNQPGQSVEGAQAAGFWDFVRMMLVLALVVAAIYGVYFLIRKNKKKENLEVGMIKILGSRSLPGNHYLHVVELGNHVLLIGNADHGINVLKEISDPETLDEIRLKAGEDNESPRTFGDLLQNIFKAQGMNAAHQKEIEKLREKKKRFGKFGDHS